MITHKERQINPIPHHQFQLHPSFFPFYRRQLTILLSLIKRTTYGRHTPYQCNSTCHHQRFSHYVPSGYFADVQRHRLDPTRLTVHSRECDRHLYMEQDWHNRTQCVLVPVSVLDQCEHFYMVLHFPFGPCIGPGSVPAQCPYTIASYYFLIR